MTGRNAARLTAAGLALSAWFFMPTPLAAQPAAPAEDGEAGETEEGRSMIEQGAALLLRGILTELGPRIDDMTRDMGDAMALMAPALGDLARLMDDIANYELPERLENGDIIIRRKPGAPPPPPLGEGLERMWPRDEPPALPDSETPKVDL